MDPAASWLKFIFGFFAVAVAAFYTTQLEVNCAWCVLLETVVVVVVAKSCSGQKQ